MVLEIGNYPSVIGVRVELRLDYDADDEFSEKFSHVAGHIRKEIHDINGSRYFIVELVSPIDGVRFLTVSERHAGVSIPREFSRRPENLVTVGIGAIKDDSLINRDVFDFEEVRYFAIGEIRRSDYS